MQIQQSASPPFPSRCGKKDPLWKERLYIDEQWSVTTPVLEYRYRASSLSSPCLAVKSDANIPWSAIIAIDNINWFVCILRWMNLYSCCYYCWGGGRHRPAAAVAGHKPAAAAGARTPEEEPDTAVEVLDNPQVAAAERTGVPLEALCGDPSFG